MSSRAALSEHGFQFPGSFQLSAMGSATCSLETVLPRLLMAAGVAVRQEHTRSRYSSNKRYVSVTLVFFASNRAALDKAYAVIRAHPDVQWVL